MVVDVRTQRRSQDLNIHMHTDVVLTAIIAEFAGKFIFKTKGFGAKFHGPDVFIAPASRYTLGYHSLRGSTVTAECTHWASPFMGLLAVTADWEGRHSLLSRLSDASTLRCRYVVDAKFRDSIRIRIGRPDSNSIRK